MRKSAKLKHVKKTKRGIHIFLVNKREIYLWQYKSNAIASHAAQMYPHLAKLLRDDNLDKVRADMENIVLLLYIIYNRSFFFLYN